MVNIGNNLSSEIPRVGSEGSPQGIVRVELDEAELLHVKLIAAQRANREVGISKSQYDLDKLKVEGEKAFAKFSGYRVDDSLRNSDVDKIDFEINGVAIHVVTTGTRRPKLLIPDDQIRDESYKNVDVFVLVYKQRDGAYAVLGYSTKQEVIASKPKYQPSGQLKREVEWTDLHREPIEKVAADI